VRFYKFTDVLATNLWLTGVPLPEIVQVEGWKTENQMKR
jgi:hypothetical protein